MKNYLFGLVLLFSGNLAFAGYNNNIMGQITGVLTYPNGVVYVTLSNQPASHAGGCSPAFFELDKNMDPEILNRMYSRILTAYAKGESLNIGYDDGSKSDSACSDSGVIPIFRAG